MASQIEETNGARKSRHASLPGQRSKNDTWQKTVDEFQQTYVQQRPVKPRGSTESSMRRNHYGTHGMDGTVASTAHSHVRQTARSRATQREQDTAVEDIRMTDNRRDPQHDDDRRGRADIDDSDGYLDADNRLRFSPTSKTISDSYYAGRRRKRKETVGDRAADFVDDIIEGVRSILSPQPKRRSRSMSRLKLSRASETGQWSSVGGRRSSSGSRDTRAPQNTSVVNIYQEHLTEKIRAPRSRGHRTSGQSPRTSGRNHSTDSRTRNRRDASQSSLARTARSTDAAVQFHRADIRDEDDDTVGRSGGERLSMRSANSSRRDVGFTRAATIHDLRYDEDFPDSYRTAEEGEDAMLRLRPVPGSGRSSRSSRGRPGGHRPRDRKQDVPDGVGKGRSTAVSAGSGAYSTSVKVSSDAVNHRSAPERRSEIPRKKQAPEPPTINSGTVTNVTYDDSDLHTTRTFNAYETRQQPFDTGATDRLRKTPASGTFFSVVSLPNPTLPPRGTSHSRPYPDTDMRSPVLTLTGPGAQHDTLHPFQSQTFSVYHNAPTILLRAQGEPMRNGGVDVGTSLGGTFSNEPLVLADLNRHSGGSEPVLPYPGYVVAESRSGTIYGTRPCLNMNKSQMLNMYVFNKARAPTERHSAENQVDVDDRNSVITSRETDFREVYINHKGTQTPSPINTRVLHRQRQDLVPVSRATRTPDTLQLSTRQPRNEGRRERVDVCYEEMRSPVSEYVRHINTYNNAPHSTSAIPVKKPNIVEVRQLERTSNTYAPPDVPIAHRDTTVHLADMSRTYDEIASVDLSRSESDDGETETVTVEEKETKVAITLFEEIEFNTTSTPGGRVLPGGDRGVDIDQWWVPNKYETRVDRRRTKRVLVKELASEGDTLPLNNPVDTADDRITTSSPVGRHSTSHARPSSRPTRTVNDDSHYCSMTGASDKRSDVNRGSVILNRQRYIDMNEMLDGGLPRGAAEQREGGTAAGPVILEDTTLTMERTTGTGDRQPDKIDDDGIQRRVTEASQTTGRPFRKSKLTRQAPVKRRPMGFSRQLSLGSAANRARNTIDADIDRKTFYYPNDGPLSEEITPLGRQVSLPADFGSVAKSERQPLSTLNGQTVERHQPRDGAVACAPQRPATTEQMAEDGYISLDLFSDVRYSAPDDVTAETTTKLEPYDVDVQEATVSVGDVPEANTPLERPDGTRRRDDTTPPELPAHYPVDNTMATRM